MISILIPVYNYDVRDLVSGLHAQGMKLNKPFEIIVMDDGSNDKNFDVNSKLSELQHVKYIALEQNIGRSKIRNLLADKAQYPYLLFIDADAGIANPNFLREYVRHCNESTSVVCGGLCYENEKDIDKQYRFRWYYGTQREEKKADLRNQKPYDGFSTFNFLTSKDIHQEIRFDESMRRYGHEDTMYGINLETLKIPITHIDNPLIHRGLEDANTFLNKTRQGLRNLKCMLNKGEYTEEIIKNINILRIYSTIKKYKACILVRFAYGLLYPLIVWNLKSRKPKLWVFDFFKLGYLCSI